MNYPTWPSTLPLPKRAGYGIDDKSAILRSQMADGQSRQRRRFSNPPGELPVQWSFTGDQHALFRGFLENECGGGVNWFSLRILFPGEGLKEQTVRLKPGMKTRLWGQDIWNITATIEIKAQPVYNESTYFEKLIAPYTYENYLTILEQGWSTWITE